MEDGRTQLGQQDSRTKLAHTSKSRYTIKTQQDTTRTRKGTRHSEDDIA